MEVELLSEPGRLVTAKVANLRLSSEREAAEGAPSPLCANKGCDKNGDKRCKGCLSVAYCSADCQKSDWISSHKAACKTLAKQNTVRVNPGQAGLAALGMNKAGYVGSVQPWGASQEKLESEAKPLGKMLDGRVDKSAAKNEPGSDLSDGGQFLVKVQVQQGGGAGLRLPMLIYNKSRSLYRLFDSAQPQYDAVHKAVKEGGILAAKAYFWATLDKKGRLQFTISPLAPAQDW